LGFARSNTLAEPLARGTRVTLFDKRGTGLSDRLGQLPNLDQRMDDVRAVNGCCHIARAAIVGVSEGGSLATLFAASHPHRCTALILYGAFARFSDWFPTEQKFNGFLRYVDTAWGTGNSVAGFAPSKKGDAGTRLRQGVCLLLIRHRLFQNTQRRWSCDARPGLIHLRTTARRRSARQWVCPWNSSSPHT
jgi:pimeloyl-ACP methyl ester carboxylesterase